MHRVTLNRPTQTTGYRRKAAAIGRHVAAMLAALLLAPSIVSAHGRLKESVPSSGAHLTSAPASLRLVFTEAPELTFMLVQLLGPNGTPVALTPVTIAADSRRAVVASIRGAMRAGVYTVIWQMAGDDGHPVRGQFTFTIAGTDAAGAGAMDTNSHHDAASMPGGEGFGSESWQYVAIRWAQYTALVMVLGAIAFRLIVVGFLRRQQEPNSPMLADASRGAARLARVATVALAITALMRLYAQSYALHGAARALELPLMQAMLGRTAWGRGWLVQCAALVLVWFALRPSSSGRDRWLMAVAGGVLLAVSMALSGHAASSPRLTELAVVADTMHIIGAGGWLGSLLIVLAAGIPAALRLPDDQRMAGVAGLVSAYSPTALFFAGATAVTGVFAAWLHLGVVPALWESNYGRTLLVKLAVLSLVAGTGAYNWLRVKPALGRTAGVQHLRRSMKIELAVGLVVLLVTAVLVATPTAMDDAAMTMPM